MGNKRLQKNEDQKRCSSWKESPWWMQWLRHCLCTVILSFALICSVTVSASLAEPPIKKTCDGDVYERLQCRHGGVGEQIEFMGGILSDEGGSLSGKLTDGQKGQAKSSKMKAGRARVKIKGDNFKKLAKSEAKSNKNICHLVPLSDADDSDGDGICDWEQGDSNAECAAIELDGNGDLQACNPAKKNKGKGKDGLECDQTCNPEESLTEDEEAEMQLEAQIMDEAYDSLETDMREMNEDLEDLNTELETSSVYNSFMAAADGCSDVPTIPPALALSASLLRQASVTAKGIAAQAGTGCEQTAVAAGFGGNGSTVCLVFETAAAIVELAYVTVDEILKEMTGQLQTSTLACIQEMKGDMEAGFEMLSNQHTAIMANDDENTAEIMNRIQALRNELVQLLNTPQGQRPDFPKK